MKSINRLIERTKQIPTPVISSVAFMLTSLLSQALGMLTTPIFTRILSKQDYGIISVYSSWLAIVNVVATLSLAGGVFSVGMIKFKEDRDGFTSSMLILSNLATTVVLAITIIFKSVILKYLAIPTSLILLMILSQYLYPATNFWLARQRYEYKYKASTIVTVLTSVLSVIMSVILVLNYKQRLAEIKLWSSSILPLLVALVLYFVLLVKGKIFFKKSYWKYAISFNIPLLLHYLSFSILSGSDRVMIANIVDVSAAGIYGLVYTAGSLGNIVWNAINISLTPYVHQKMEEKNYSAINKISIFLLGIYALFCAFVILLAPEVIKMLAPPDYYEGIFTFPPIMISTFFISLYNVFANIEFYYQKTVTIMLASVSTAIINIILNYIFIPHFGYIAAAYTTLFSYALLTVIHFLNLRRIQETEIFNIRVIVLIGLTLIGFGFIANLLYIYVIIRYVFIILALLAAFYYRKQIISNLKLLKNKSD